MEYNDVFRNESNKTKKITNSLEINKTDKKQDEYKKQNESTDVRMNSSQTLNLKKNARNQ